MPTTTAPLGLTPLGFPSIVEADPAPTGLSQLCRYIHSGKRDYEIDETTRHFVAMPVLRQRVLLIMLMVLKSSTVLQGMGIDTPETMGDGFEGIMRLRVRAAYKQLTDVEKVMRIDDVIVSKHSTGRAAVTMTYTDLSSGLDDVVSTEDLEALR